MAAMSRRHTRFNDPVSRLATRDDRALLDLVDTLCESEKEIFVLMGYIARGDTAATVAKQIGISPRRVRMIASKVRSKLRDPSLNVPLIVDGDFRYRGDGYREFRGEFIDFRTGSLGLAEAPGWACGYASCSNTVIPGDRPQAGGRPRRYCSDACKQAAYRDRRKQSRPHGK
jgi:hypothetical protein